MIGAVLVALALWAAPAAAGSVPSHVLQALRGADVVIMGEVHDNPAHHAVQAEVLAALAPRAVVYEMLTEAQAERVTPALARDPAALSEVLNWADSGWPDFAMYAPLFAAVPEARVLGAAMPREAARAVMTEGMEAVFGAQAQLYGLTAPLPPTEQSEREAAQMQAHCNALPETMLPTMVDIQRLRDAALARAAIRALEETGGPVAVITGNGHARRDWGVPVYLARVQPGLTVFALGQSEAGSTEGPFDLMLDAPPVDRPDPCAAFEARGD